MDVLERVERLVKCLDIVAEPPELSVDVELELPRTLTRALELDEEGLTAWEHDQPVRPPAATADVELEVHDPELVEPPTEPPLDTGL